MSVIRIGISGWRYAPWRGVFYPKDLPQRAELEYASKVLPSIEINGSFYSLQTPSSYRAWAEATPSTFQFSVKCPRFITHIKRLKDIRVPLANFFASGVLRLKEKMGPLLWQFPPSFRYDEKLLDAFFELLPRTTMGAGALAREHDDHLRAPAWLKVDEDMPIRHVMEVRHRSFETPAFVEQLRRHKIGLVVADTAGRWPFMEDVTADLVYIRLHGDSELYVSGYTDAALAQWAEKIRKWSKGTESKDTRTLAKRLPARKSGRDVFVYFDNDVKVHAPFDALKLAALLGLRDSAELPKGDVQTPPKARKKTRGQA
ncbi:MAG: DUF72 domain-containing protein [Nibricoccus sp.]